MKQSLGRLVGVGLTVVLGLVWVSSVAATSASVSRSYASDVPISPGSIVSLTTLQSKTITLANTSNSDKIIGVAVGEDDSLISVDPGKDRVQVTTSGLVDVLVSDLNGDVAIGDKIAVSPFNGVGMKSGLGERIVGLAQTDFKSSAKALKTQEVTDKQGEKKTLRIGRVQINVIIGTDDGSAQDKLNGIQKLVKAATGRTVSTLRALISVVIAIIALFALLVLIYSAVFGSIISIGRNPLAKTAVFRALKSVLVLASVVAVLALLFIYLLLS